MCPCIGRWEPLWLVPALRRLAWAKISYATSGCMLPRAGFGGDGRETRTGVGGLEQGA